MVPTVVVAAILVLTLALIYGLGNFAFAWWDAPPRRRFLLLAAAAAVLVVAVYLRMNYGEMLAAAHARTR